MGNKDILKTRITGIHAVIEFDIVEPYFEKYGTEEYWNKLQKVIKKRLMSLMNLLGIIEAEIPTPFILKQQVFRCVISAGMSGPKDLMGR